MSAVSTLDWLEGATAHALDRIERLAKHATGFPVSTVRGRWQYSVEGTWTAGFWPGRLWLAQLLSGEPRFADAAQIWCARLAPHQLRRDTHDLGMLFMPSFVLGWHITGEPALKFGALAAAANLAARFNQRGGFIRALGVAGDPAQAGYVIVDTLMNLPLLFWAARETGEERYAAVAAAHAATSRQRHIRDDGSTWQVFNFDTESGSAIGPGYYQGLSVDSCWSRGQAWAIYGLAAAYRWTRDAAILADAERVADWWLAHEPAGGVPPWDFVASGDDEPKDTSAAAIAACGLLDLAACGHPEYRTVALRAARALYAAHTSRDDREEGILLHGTGVKPRGREIDVSLSYGDYFYVELLLRLARPDAFAAYVSAGA